MAELPTMEEVLVEPIQVLGLQEQVGQVLAHLSFHLLVS